MSLKRIALQGAPSVLNRAALSDHDKGIVDPIVTPTPPDTSFPALVSDFLTGFLNKAVAVVLPMQRKIVGSDDEDARLSIINSVVDAYDGEPCITLTPVANQTGVSLSYNKAVTGSPGTNAAGLIALADAMVTAVKPKLSVQSIISRVLSAPYEDGKAPTIMVDQVNGVIKIYPFFDDAEEGIESGADANAIQMALTGESVDVVPTTERLVFEGGEV